MPARKAKQAVRAPRNQPQAGLLREQDSQETMSKGDSDDPVEKDETEIELEKLLFGDNTGFHESLKSRGAGFGSLFPLADEQSQPGDVDELDNEGLEEVNDADVRKLDHVTLPIRPG